MYGNLLGLEMCTEDNIIWHILGLGSETEIHGVYFEDNPFEMYSTTVDTVSVFAYTSKSFYMQPTTPG